MKDITKYQGVIPAFYACYDEKGEISTEGVKALTSMWTSVKKCWKQLWKKQKEN